MALQSADFDPTDPQQQVRRRLMTRFSSADPTVPQADAMAPMPSADFGPTGGVVSPMPVASPIPDVPSAGVPTLPEPPVRQPPAIDYAPETPKITAGPVATQPLTPAGDPSDVPPNRGPVD